MSIKKVILYGCGSYFKKNQDLLPTDIQVVAYCYSERISYLQSAKDFLLPNIPIICKDDIPNYIFDEIVICSGPASAPEIYLILKNALKIDKHRISLFDHSKSDWSLYNCDLDSEHNMIVCIQEYKFYLNGDSDFRIISEIFINNAYDISVPNKNSVLVDIGMNVGMASLYFSGVRNISKIYGFEPFCDTYNYALNNFNANSKSLSEKIIPINLALSDFDGEIDVCSFLDNLGGRSIIPEFGNKQEKRFSIVCKKSSEVVNRIIEENCESDIYIKIDTEGSEIQIIRDLINNDIIKKIKAIILEYHNNADKVKELFDIANWDYYRSGRKYSGIIFAYNHR